MNNFKFYLACQIRDKNENIVSSKSFVVHQGLNGPRREKTCLRGFANNTGAPAHPRSLISTFVNRFLESILCKLTPLEI